MSRKPTMYARYRVIAEALAALVLVVVGGIACWSQVVRAQVESPPIVASLAATRPHEPIELRSRRLEVPSDPDRAMAALEEIPSEATRHVILQLDRVPTAEERDQLAGAGIKVVQYLGSRGWYAAVPGGLDHAVLREMGIIAAWQIESADRLDPTLLTGRVPEHARRPRGDVSVSVLAFSDANGEDLAREIESMGGMIEAVVPEFDLLFVRIQAGLLPSLADIDGIQWIEPVAPTPQPEMNRAASFLKSNTVQAAPYSLTGAGVDVSVHDSGHAFRHNDYYSRWMKGDADSLSVEQHASMTAGTIAGGGTGNATYKGMAPGATIVTYAYRNDMAANNYGDIKSALTRGVEIGNNSWGYFGCGITIGLPYGNYTSQARVYDLAVRGQDSAGQAIGSPMLVVFSAGNERSGYASGNSRLLDCIAEDVAPFRNYGTINQPKSAKNIIAVGAVDSADSRMSTFSSWGPTSDGRLKPDLVAAGLHNGPNVSGVSDLNNCFGNPVASSSQQCYRTTNNTNTNDPSTGYDDRYAWFSQTSAAAAMVSGSAALFIQDFRARSAGRTPLPSTTKAHLIHAARDLNDSTTWYNPGPDYASGYGVLDIKAAIDQLRSGRWLEDSVDAGQSRTYWISVPSGASLVKLTLAWDDVPGAPATTAAALINDLDLVVTDSSGARRYPWTLSPNSPSANAVRSAEDHRNNVEVVQVSGTVPAGVWNVTVRGTTVPSGPQAFSLVSSHPATSAPPDLIISALSGSSVVAPGQSVNLSETTKNQGSRSAVSSMTKFYWSSNSSYEATDTYLGQRSVPALAGGAISGPATTTVRIPAVGKGTYYILAKADSTGAVVEFYENNNVTAWQVGIGPDLIVSALSAPAAVASGQSVNLSETTRNQGSTSAVSSMTKFYWSSNSTYEATDTYLGQRSVPALAGGASSGPATTTVRIPAVGIGNYYILAVADATAVNVELSETNNAKSWKVTVGPDLIVSALTAPSSASRGSVVTVGDTTRNAGSANAGATSTRYYLSKDATYSPTDLLLASRSVPALAAGTSNSGTITSRIPSTALAGTYYLIAVADAARAVVEASENNNTRAMKVTIM